MLFVLAKLLLKKIQIGNKEKIMAEMVTLTFAEMQSFINYIVDNTLIYGMGYKRVLIDYCTAKFYVRQNLSLMILQRFMIMNMKSFIVIML